MSDRCFHVTAFAFAAVLMATPAVAQSPVPLKVAVTLKPVHALAMQVLEGVTVPSLVVDGTASPHTYALKPSDAKLLNDADLVIRVSETLEPFMAKVVRSLPTSVTVVTLEAAAGVEKLPRRVGTTFEADDHDHDHAANTTAKAGAPTGSTAIDGHLWLDPRNAKAFVAEIARAAIAKRPGDAATINANAVKAAQRLDVLDGDLKRLLQPAAGKPYIVFHDALQYLDVRYGLMPVGSITIDPDTPPSGKRIADLRKKVRSLKAVCVFSEPGNDGRLVRSVMEVTSARTGVLDPEGLGVPRGADAYDTIMKRLATSLQGCLAPNT